MADLPRPATHQRIAGLRMGPTDAERADALAARVAELEGAVEAAKEAITDYMAHDSWRCYSKGYYPNECCCGLDNSLVAIGLDPADFRMRVQHPTEGDG